MFCENSLCRAHVECADTTVRMCYTELDGNVVNLRRFIIRCLPDGSEFKLCEICCNVAAMIHGTQEKVAA